MVHRNHVWWKNERVCDDDPAIEGEGVRMWLRFLKLVKFGLIASFVVDDMH